MPRKDMSLSEKIAVLDNIKCQPNNTSHRQLAWITKVPKSTITRLMLQEKKLREEWALNEGLKRASYKRKREIKNPDVEDALNQWFFAVTEQGMNVNRTMLKTKSEELAQKLGNMNFKATDGWLSRWKYRNDINSKIVSLKKNGVKNIHSAGKTDQHYQATLNSSLSYKLQCHHKIGDCEEVFSEQVVAQHPETPGDPENCNDLTERVTHQDALKCIAKLRHYFLQEDNEATPFSALDTCADFVQFLSIKRTCPEMKEVVPKKQMCLLSETALVQGIKVEPVEEEEILGPR